MKASTIAFGVLAATATWAMPAASTAGARVNVGISVVAAPVNGYRDGRYDDDRRYQDAGRHGYDLVDHSLVLYVKPKVP